MLVRGHRKDGTQFEVRSTIDETFELEGEIHLDAGRVNQFVVGFAVNGWVKQGDLGLLAGEPIVIDADSNRAVYDRFEDAVAESPRLFVGNTTRRPVAD